MADRTSQELLRMAVEYDFKAMLEVFPNGWRDNTDVEDYEYVGSYQEDARYVQPARDGLRDMVLSLALARMPEAPYKPHVDEFGHSDWRDTGEMGG